MKAPDTQGITLPQVTLAAGVSCFLGLTAAGTIFLFLRWLTDLYLPGWIFLLALGAADATVLSLLFRPLYLSYTFWLHPAAIPRRWLLPLLWLAAALLLGTMTTRRKDFLRVQQKTTDE